MNFTKTKKFLKDWKWSIILVLICIAGIPLTTIYGIQSVTWGNDFWPNALSEFLGMFVELIFGAIFTFVVIDKYIQYHKSSQWRKIKNITYKNLYFVLSNFLLKLNLSLPKEMRLETYILSEDIETLNDYLPKADFSILANSLVKNIDKKIQENSTSENNGQNITDSFKDEQLYSSLIKFKQHSKVDITALSTLTIPKLLNFSDDIVLLDNVIELEELLTSLLSKIKTMHSQTDENAFHIKFIWLQKLQEILNEIVNISDSIKDEIDID